jgi:hypothetical protein
MLVAGCDHMRGFARRTRQQERGKRTITAVDGSHHVLSKGRVTFLSLLMERVQDKVYQTTGYG